MAIPFLLVVALRAVSLRHLLEGGGSPRNREAARPSDGALPVYTVLVPLFREAPVVPHLLRALATIDYPADKLEVLLIVESIDQETQAALRSAGARRMRVLVVPTDPAHKPRALQYEFAQGDYVVVYDAGTSLPDQLRRPARRPRHKQLDAAGAARIYNSCEAG
jgi:cellulose synthase/poly-beta-1,6-N-acetylglucosamine synthase-like glycosyltransferase